VALHHVAFCLQMEALLQVCQVVVVMAATAPWHAFSFGVPAA